MFWKRKDKFCFLKSIRVRLILGYTCILFVSIIAVSLYLSFQMKKRLFALTRQYVASELKTAINFLENEEGGEMALSGFLSKHTRQIRGSHKAEYALFDSEGRIIARSKDFSEDAASLKETLSSYHDRIPSVSSAGKNDEQFLIHESTSRDADNNAVYLVTRPFRDDKGTLFYLQFAVTPFGHQEAFKVFLRTALVTLPFILLFGLISGIMLTRQFLSPISALISASGAIARFDSSQELPLRGTGDELDKLACAFNNVLKELRRAYQRIIVFTANASHEIRLPITAIKGEAEVILARGADIEEFREVMGNIVIEMDRLTGIINRLLYLSRGDSGLDTLQVKRVELNGLLSKMVEFYRVLAQKKDIALSFPEQDERFYTRADPSKLEELFSNLIENAIRYTHSNGSIAVTLQEQPDGYAVRVSDTGIGIPKEEQEKIFERFYRVDKARSREEGGAGLGLSIATMIAKAHQGRISVESTPQKGSTFTVFLPRA